MNQGAPAPVTTDPSNPAPTPADAQAPTPSAAAPRLDDAERALGRLAERARAVLVGQRLARGLTAVLGVVVILATADYILRLPVGLRFVNLSIGLIALAWLARRRLAPALRLRPTPATMALRVERRRPDLAGTLASGVEFDTDPTLDDHVTAMERTLARRVVTLAADAFTAGDTRGMLRLRTLARSVLALAVVVMAVGAIGLTRPDLTGIGLARTLTPWAGAHWPKRAVVADATGLSVHPLGAAVPLRAVLVRSVRDPDRTDVTVEYRPVRAGRAGASRTALLTWQRRTTESDDGRAGELFERLVDADADAIEYRFVTLDDHTDWRRVRLVPPPAIANARVRIEPPAYTRGLASAERGGPVTEPTEVELGTGADERAVAPPALAGSRIRLVLTLNKPIPASPEDPGWLAATFGPDAQRAGVTLTVSPEKVDRASRPSSSATVGRASRPSSDAAAQWTLAWTLDQSVRMPISLKDEFGIASVDEAVFRFESLADRPATATITEPASDRNVLATAVVRIVGEGRDDVGLASVALERQRVRPAGSPEAPSGPGGAVVPAGEPVRFAHVDPAGARRAETEATIDLAPLGLRPGDQVWLTALAEDVYAIAGAPRPATRSAARILRVITEAEFVDEIRGELSSVRQGAIRLFEEQQALRDMPPARRAGAEAQRRQAQLTERLTRLTGQLDRVQQRVKDNALGDRQLKNVLDDADRLLTEAGQWSARASDRQAEADKARDPEQDEVDPEHERQIDDAQQRVQDELTALAELLDTGQDAWVSRRQLESLLKKQRDLAGRTAKAGRATAGKKTAELSDAERSELEQIVQKQQELAEQADALADDLEKRADQLEPKDPASAAGMRAAARTARESQVSETMRQAAKQAQQNKTADAGQQQQKAAEDLEQMLGDLDDAERTREEVLRRVLASLIESLDALITQQETEIGALAAATDAGKTGDLDRGMIRLNQNTLGVLDQASGAGRELAPVADLIGRAVEAQTQAIIALRADPVDAAHADEQEQRSLGQLREARDLAKKLDQQMQQREQDRARGELRKAYRAALERQVAVRESTGKLAEIAQPDRRQRLALRKLAAEEQDIAAALADLRKKTKELAEARVFDYAHSRLADLLARAADALAGAGAKPAMPPEDSAVAIIQGLVEALRQTPPGKQDFDSGAQGGGGGGGSGKPQPLIPPIAELRLLRQIQIDLARRTRALDESGGAGDRAKALGEEQSELGELGEDLVRRMKEQQPQAPSAPTGEPPQ